MQRHRPAATARRKGSRSPRPLPPSRGRARCARAQVACASLLEASLRPQPQAQMTLGRRLSADRCTGPMGTSTAKMRADTEQIEWERTPERKRIV
eukprot:6191913-Pleurochrysis_carterae.AAC.4